MKASVLIVTYNHEKFIARALDSALMQETDFDYEIVIGEDCSTDRTREIVLEYRNRYPDRIKLLLNETNLGARNYINTCGACSGKYIANLDGDDFWISSDKLREQVAFLDNNPSFAMCFTNSNIVNENDSIVSEERLGVDRKKILSQTDIVSGLVPPSNTIVFRSIAIKDVPDVYYTIANGDIMFYAMLAGHGDAAYIDKIMASYRVHSGGTWSSKPQEYILTNNLKTRLALLSVYSETYGHILMPVIRGYYYNLLEYYKKNNKITKYAATLVDYIINDIKNNSLSFVGKSWHFTYSLLFLLKNRIMLRL